MKFRREGRYWVDLKTGDKVPVIAGGEAATIATVAAIALPAIGSLLSGGGNSNRKLARISSAGFDTNTIHTSLVPAHYIMQWLISYISW